MKRHRQRVLDRDDPSDHERMYRHRIEFLKLANSDLRICEVRQAWARSLTPTIARMITADSDALANFIWERERPAAAARLIAVLDLPFTCEWLGPWLADANLQAAWEVIYQTRLKAVFMAIDPPGRSNRSAKNAGRHIARDVGWVYRSLVKVPRDSISRLAREDLAATPGRTKLSRGVVQDGIRRAMSIMEMKFIGH